MVNNAMQAAWDAFKIYKTLPLAKRASLLRTIATEIEALGPDLISVCMSETNLPEARLLGERARTIFQLTSYADACESGRWLEASIDTANTNRVPVKPDLRKMKVPLGPVIVFGASNFPFAYSTAGGDTASALAAGCPVVVKAHNAHIRTSTMVAEAVHSAIRKCGLPEGFFSHLQSNDNALGKELVMHPYTKAVGFTGSFAGGKAIWEYANARKEPIPVFAEMSSVNPVFILPGKLAEDPAGLARTLAASITLGCGQFCTNPGILVAIKSEALDNFKEMLAQEIHKVSPALMLHNGIADNFYKTKARVLEQKGVTLLAESDRESLTGQDKPSVAGVTAGDFLNNPLLQSEVFGSFSLLVTCNDDSEMLAVATGMEGQLTSSLMATEEDMVTNRQLLSEMQEHCGRLICNGVPTGVEVVLSMHHGGPYPSSTDSRFTSVGADAILRFARPMCFQNWPDEMLPDELKNSNPLGIWRTVDNELTKAPVKQ